MILRRAPREERPDLPRDRCPTGEAGEPGVPSCPPGHRTRAGDLKIDGAAPEITGIVELALRLGARLHLAPVRRDVEELVLEGIAAIRDGRGAAASAAEISSFLALAERLGLRVDLWEAQNRVWGWTGSSAVTLDREAVAELARHLWFDPPTLLRRAGFAARA